MKNLRQTTLSGFFTDPHVPLVADASAIINLNATSHVQALLAVVPHPIIVTGNAVSELERGVAYGHTDLAQIEAHIAEGSVQRHNLDASGTDVYERLIYGKTVDTLDDGEAATIGYAVSIGGIALLDERKARYICAKMFPFVEIVSTVDLLLHPSVEAALGRPALADAVFGALQDARMRVPHVRLGHVVDLIGRDRARLCPSLPLSVRS